MKEAIKGQRICRVGVKAELTFGSKKAKFGVGVEGGVQTGLRHDINVEMESNSSLSATVNGAEPITITDTINASSCVRRDLNQTKGYITPTLSADVKLGKKGKFSFIANADLPKKKPEGQVGIRYNF